MKIMRKKSLLAVSIALFMTFSVACGTKTETASTETKAATTAASAETASTAPTEAVKDATINVFTSTGTGWSEDPGFLATIKGFNAKYPNIKVEINAVPKMEEVLPMKIASGDLPDVAYFHSGAYWLRALNVKDNFIAMDDPEFLANALDSVKSLCQLEGKTYAAPYGSMTISGVLYNKEIFEKNGIQIPKNNTEFLAACEKLKSAGITPIALGGKDAWSLQLPMFDKMAAAILKNPNLINDINANKATFDKSPEFLQALTEFKEYAEKGYVNKDMLSANMDKANEYLGTGKVAMMFNATWADTDYAKKYPSAKIGMFPTPFGDTAASANFGCNAFLIPKAAKELEAAKIFTKYAVSKEGYELYYKAIPSIPVAKDINIQLGPISTDGAAIIKSGAVEGGFKDIYLVAPIGAWENSLQELLIKRSPAEIAAKVQAEFQKNAKATKVPGF